MRARAAWLAVRRETPLRALARLPLLPPSWLYGAAVWGERALYRKGVLRRSHFPGHVVSVGNLVVGGTGKTPLAAWIASGLRRRGHKVAIASLQHAMALRPGHRGALIVMGLAYLQHGERL